MKVSTLQSLIDKNAKYISYIEGEIELQKGWAKERPRTSLTSFYYNNWNQYKKTLHKSVELQKELKAELKKSIEFERLVGALIKVFGQEIK